MEVRRNICDNFCVLRSFCLYLLNITNLLTHKSLFIMKHLITFIIGILCFSSCSDNYKKQYEEAEKQITALKIENERLLKGLKDSETIIEGYRNSPQKLLASATQMLKEKNLPQLLNIKNELTQWSIDYGYDNAGNRIRRSANSMKLSDVD